MALRARWGRVAPDDVLPPNPWPGPGALRWAFSHLLVSRAGCCHAGHGASLGVSDPVFGNSASPQRGEALSGPCSFLWGLIQLVLVAPLRRAGPHGGPTAAELPGEGQHTGDAGTSRGWGRGFILQAAAGEAPPASASSHGGSCSCHSPSAGLSHLAKPAEGSAFTQCWGAGGYGAGTPVWVRGQQRGREVKAGAGGCRCLCRAERAGRSAAVAGARVQSVRL